MSKIPTQCFICKDNDLNLNRCAIILSPVSKRKASKRYPLCSFCFGLIKRLFELKRGINEGRTDLKTALESLLVENDKNKST